MPDEGTRFPTTKEFEIFRKTRNSVMELSDYMDGTAFLVANLSIANDFSKKMGFQRRFADQQFFDAFSKKLEKVDRLRSAFDAVERRELLLSYRKGGEDFDIVSPITENQSYYDKYRLDGFPLVALATVVVLIAAAVITVAAIWRDAEKIKAESEKREREAERYFCSDKDSSACLMWLKKEKARIENNKSLANELFKGLGKGLGAGIGVAAIVALGLWAFSKQRSK